MLSWRQCFSQNPSPATGLSSNTGHDQLVTSTCNNSQSTPAADQGAASKSTHVSWAKPHGHRQCNHASSSALGPTKPIQKTGRTSEGNRASAGSACKRVKARKGDTYDPWKDVESRKSPLEAARLDSINSGRDPVKFNAAQDAAVHPPLSLAVEGPPTRAKSTSQGRQCSPDIPTHIYEAFMDDPATRTLLLPQGPDQDLNDTCANIASYSKADLGEILSQNLWPATGPHPSTGHDHSVPSSCNNPRITPAAEQLLQQEVTSKHNLASRAQPQWHRQCNQTSAAALGLFKTIKKQGRTGAGHRASAGSARKRAKAVKSDTYDPWKDVESHKSPLEAAMLDYINSGRDPVELDAAHDAAAHDPFSPLCTLLPSLHRVSAERHTCS